ncbi:MAG: ABC transporter permease [Ruminococcaceae bacterium]|nr:ABC transporter permease [Oscillospiraceae bacterium]
MTQLRALIYRNTKLYFKDKGMFFTSLITPMVLMLLYVTFLANVYRDSFASAAPEGISGNYIDALVAGEVVSSLLAVSCVTVSFCCNLLMVQDKACGNRADLTIAPVKNKTLALGYYIATLVSSSVICLIATALGFGYIATMGWYLSMADVLLILADVFLLVMFGTALSSVIGFFLSTLGQLSAVGTVVSSAYGFLCGAYMPISQFSEGLQKVIKLLPGTYGTVLTRYHCTRGVFEKMQEAGMPQQYVQNLMRSIDCRIEIGQTAVSAPVMYLILGTTVCVLIGAYIFMNQRKAKE